MRRLVWKGINWNSISMTQEETGRGSSRNKRWRTECHEVGRASSGRWIGGRGPLTDLDLAPISLKGGEEGDEIEFTAGDEKIKKGNWVVKLPMFVGADANDMRHVMITDR